MLSLQLSIWTSSLKLNDYTPMKLIQEKLTWYHHSDMSTNYQQKFISCLTDWISDQQKWTFLRSFLGAIFGLKMSGTLSSKKIRTLGLARKEQEKRPPHPPFPPLTLTFYSYPSSGSIGIQTVGPGTVQDSISMVLTSLRPLMLLLIAAVSVCIFKKTVSC